ncbi:ABC transporter ATP-binding protein [Thalassospira marina]|uniref:Polyamine ABC transporter ATP-binding protein n=1 Tax=Thalassospira marina TaxID=2048283 RepID=A0A2N3KG82_9PROT|nr:ABC transporter ATP-binding protein [Thalassospira marina]AUG53117.1 polyamine ABC transporter ATP-binding protein [Thalassospira marina]PKR49579.1 polyamine ABC transporter ATP-binding protein [Thalassospira marina]
MAERQNAVELRNVVKRYGEFTAVKKMDLTVPENSFVTFLGPSGCGKTTTLRMIAGLTDISEGDLMIRDRRVNDLPIHKRNLGLVFQNYALFPHKTIFDNIAFGLKYRKIAKADIARKVQSALELVQLPHVAERYPNQLSGGQQQRIALARAIVIEPDVLLLDEPLSALDANLREEMRVELKRIQRELGIATVFVTHDQSEALAMSDKLVVMNNGVVEQEGAPEDVYNNPSSAFVADFLGHSNIFAGQLAEPAGDTAPVHLQGGPSLLTTAHQMERVAHQQNVRAVIRAEKITVSTDKTPISGDAGTSIPGRVKTVDYLGQMARYFITAEGRDWQVINPIDQHPFSEGAEIFMHIPARNCVLLPGHSD